MQTTRLEIQSTRTRRVSRERESDFSIFSNTDISRSPKLSRTYALNATRLLLLGSSDEINSSASRVCCSLRMNSTSMKHIRELK
jgi:hypothetical protein